MKIIYINNSRLPTEKAHGYQICKMCEQFAQAGAEVELWFPARQSRIKEDAFNFYGVKPIFRIREINSFNWLRFDKYLGRLSFWLNSWFFFMVLFFTKVDRGAVVYTRNIEISWLFNLKKNKAIYEDHRWPETKVWLYKFLAKTNDRIVVITAALKNLYVANGFNKNKILVAPDGVDISEFNLPIAKKEARRLAGLPLDKKVVMYTGHLYEWKGAQTLADAAGLLGDDIAVVFIGGAEDDIKKFKNKNSGRKNILIIGYIRHGRIPLFLKAADVLVLPNLGDEKISSSYTSPLKLFEYMAAARPIAASDLPSIREILNINNSILVEPGDAKSLANGIKQVLSDKELGDKISRQAYSDVQKYAWEKRAKSILKFIEKI